MWLRMRGEVWSARLHTPARSRVMLAVCLLFWSVGWLAAGAVCLRVFVPLAASLLKPLALATQAPMQPATPVVVVLSALCLLLWLLVLTPVGFIASFGLGWSLLGWEQVTFDWRGVTRERWWGPWHRALHVRYADMVDLYQQGHGGSVMALLPTGESVSLAQGGSTEQHQELWTRMRELSGLGGSVAELTRHVPLGREAVALARGGELLRSARTTRVRWAWFQGGVALLLAVTAGVLLWRQLFDGASFTASVLAACLGTLAVLVGRRGVYTLQAREGWEVHRGSLVHVRRGLLKQHRVRYAVTELTVEREVNEEREVSFSLWLRSPEGSLQLMRSTFDLRPLEHLGHWLAHRLDAPFRRDALADAAGVTPAQVSPT